MKDVTAAILIENGKVLIARRRAGDPAGGLWEFPGGKVEPGETPAACLARELREELALQVTVGELFAESCYDYAGGSIRLLAMWVSDRVGEPHCREHAALAWVPLTDLHQYTFLPADRPIVAELQLSSSAAPSDGPRHCGPTR